MSKYPRLRFRLVETHSLALPLTRDAALPRFDANASVASQGLGALMDARRTRSAAAD